MHFGDVAVFQSPGDPGMIDGSATMPKGGLSASSPASVAHQRSHSLSGVQVCKNKNKISN